MSYVVVLKRGGREVAHNFANIPIHTILGMTLMLILLLPSSIAFVGIDSSDPRFFIIFNNDARYFVDRNAFIISNTAYPEIQAKMEWCVSGRVGITSFFKCFDEANLNWEIDTDNLTFAHLTAYGAYQGIDVNLLYALDSPDQNSVLIRPLLTNTNFFNVQDANIIFKHTDINISMDSQNDRLQFYKNGLKDFDLVGLEGDVNALDENRFRLYDSQWKNDIILWWDSVGSVNDTNFPSRVLLRATPEAGQLFSPISLVERIGTFYAGDTIKTNLWWKDVQVPTAVKLYHPDSNLTYDYNTNIKADCFVTIGGTGGASNYVGRLQDCNNSTCSQLQDMTTLKSNQVLTIINGDANPLTTTTANVDLNWTLSGSGSDLNGGTRYVRCKVDSNLASGCTASAPCYSTIRSITINPAPSANRVIDVNIVKPNGGEIIGVRDGNYRIDFNVSDKDYNGIFWCGLSWCKLDANIDYNVGGGWKRIVTDLNLLATATAGSNKGIYCDDLNFAGSKDQNKQVTCHYDWNLAAWREPSVDSKIDVNVTDNNGSTDTNRSANKFRLHNWLVSRESDATTYNPQRKLARNVDGNRIYLVFHTDPPNSASGDSWYTKSDDNGLTWFTPLNISDNIGNSHNPTLAVDSNNTMYVTWTDYTTNASLAEIYYRSCNNLLDCTKITNWSSTVNLSNTPSGGAQTSSVAVDKDKNVYVMWDDSQSGNLEVTYKNCRNDLDCSDINKWSANLNLSNSSGNSQILSLATDKDGNIYTVWFDAPTGTNRDILYKSCRNDLNCAKIGSWTLDVNLSRNPIFSFYAAIAIDKDGNKHVVWSQASETGSGKYRVSYKSCGFDQNCADFSKWGNDFNVSTQNATDNDYPTIATDNDSNVYVIWEDFNTNNWNINYRKRNAVGGSWDFNIIKTNDTKANRFPNIDFNTIKGTSEYLDYVYMQGAVADFNIVFVSEILKVPPSGAPPPSNNPIDVNVVRDFNFNTLGDMNGYDGNEIIDFNVHDDDWNGIFFGSGWLDANIDFRDSITGASTRIVTDLNLVTTAAAGSNTGLYCDDLNFAGGKDINRYGVTCHWQWNLLVPFVADGNYFIDVNVHDNNGSNDIDAGDYSFRVVSNRIPDVNIIKLDGNRVNQVMPIFYYSIDKNLTIDFNVFDLDWNGISYGFGRLDANIDWQDVNGEAYRIITDLNLLSTATAGSNKGRYCDDLNFAGGKDINKYGTTCHWDFNYMRVPDTNIWIDVNVSDHRGKINTDTNTNDFNFKIALAPPPINNLPDANITKVDGNLTSQAMAPQFNYYVDGNFTIDFNVSDLDWNGNYLGHGRLDINIDYRKTDTNASTRIITDLNMTNTLYCDDQNFASGDINKSGAACHWDWNAIAVADGNYTLDINISDGNSTAIKYGDFNFYVKNIAPPVPPAAMECIWWKGGTRCLWEWIWKEEDGEK